VASPLGNYGAAACGPQAKRGPAFFRSKIVRRVLPKQFSNSYEDGLVGRDEGGQSLLFEVELADATR